jgi:hypothetical protein
MVVEAKLIVANGTSHIAGICILLVSTDIVYFEGRIFDKLKTCAGLGLKQLNISIADSSALVFFKNPGHC